ncbi:alpha-mannosidase [Naumannella huperziae]
MYPERALLQERLARFRRDHLEPAVVRDRVPLTITRWDAPDEPVPFDEAAAASYTRADIGDPWGRPWGTTWFRLTGAIPGAWHDQPGTRAELIVDLGWTGGPGFQAEALAYRPDGTIIKALEPYNSWLPVTGDAIDVLVEAAGNPDLNTDFRPSPMGDKATAPRDPLYRLRTVEAALLDEVIIELLADLDVLDGLMAELPESSPRRAEILAATQRAVDAVDPDDVPGTARAGRDQLADVLARPASASAHTVYAVGHAHIDSAWLWPVRETIRKCARTFSNVCDLMDRDPDFVFACSSAQQYAWMKEHYPDVFARITEKVAEGRFVPVGGMWVESDTNMPGGEAMARQFVAGKTFFLDNFGVDTEEVWLPDSFGYSAGLPQIARAAGARWFLTQKISWNQTNKMPHHTFWWEGIDGSKIFTHFPPVDTYNAQLSQDELAHAERNYADAARANLSLAPFGWGDGGGGPTREQLAAGRRAADLEGSPRVRFSTPRAFFTEAQELDTNPPTWRGEMYLELHRGTLTSQARTKRGNRRSEHLLREAELWASTATLLRGAAYPYDELTELWQLVLLQQFHDILPGSSIAWVHSDAERNYAAIQSRLEEIIARALSVLGDSAAGSTMIANAAPHARDGVPAMAIGAPATATPATVVADGDNHVLDNGSVRAVIDPHGRITSLIDAASGREAIAPGGAGNVLELHRDIPNQWDAWDIDEHYRRNVVELADASAREAAVGPEGSAVVTVSRDHGRSTITQRIVLRPGADALEIETVIDWHERQKLLKLGFALDVHAEHSSAETQFGHVRRPTHVNTSWEWARFEFCAHRFLHVGEPGYGVAIANDATYGHEVVATPRAGGGRATTVRLSLLRAPLYPDPEADQGEHRHVVAVRPGAGIAEAVELGYRTNLEPRRLAATQPVDPLISIDNPAIVVESIKLAEDRSGDVIVRLYESLGGRADGLLTTGFPAGEIRETDLIERTPPEASGAVRTDGDGTALALRPFQLLTLRISPAS